MTGVVENFKIILYAMQPFVRHKKAMITLVYKFSITKISSTAAEFLTIITKVYPLLKHFKIHLSI